MLCRSVAVTWGGSSALSKGKVGVPLNGAVIIATAGQMSGRVMPHQAASGEPASRPMTAATER